MSQQGMMHPLVVHDKPASFWTPSLLRLIGAAKSGSMHSHWRYMRLSIMTILSHYITCSLEIYVWLLKGQACCSRLHCYTSPVLCGIKVMRTCWESWRTSRESTSVVDRSEQFHRSDYSQRLFPRTLPFSSWTILRLSTSLCTIWQPSHLAKTVPDSHPWGLTLFMFVVSQILHVNLTYRSADHYHIHRAWECQSLLSCLSLLDRNWPSWLWWNSSIVCSSFKYLDLDIAACSIYVYASQCSTEESDLI